MTARAAYPVLTTAPSALSVFDFDNHFRVQQWDDRPESIRMIQQENDAQLLTLLDRLPQSTRELTNPIIRWRIDTRLNEYTSLNRAVTASDTYIDLADSYIVRAGSGLLFPSSGAQMMVDDVDDDYSEGWTNAAGNACNVKVDRTKLGGPQVAIAVGAEARAMAAYMGELSEPRESTTTTPGDPVYNFIALQSIYFTMSKMQLEAAMLGGWGTYPKEMENAMFRMRNTQQTSMFFQYRATWYDEDERQVYIGNGLLPQLNDYVIDIGFNGNKLTWPILNDTIELTFDSKLSSTRKTAFFGKALYRDALKTARAMGRIADEGKGETYYDPDLGSMMFTLSTDQGNMVDIHLEKYSLNAGFAYWGFVLDQANLGSGYYRGLQNQVIPDIQNPRAILRKDTALLNSWVLNVFDPSTMCIFRGGTDSITNR
ncbi:MAG: hypothetical protein EOM12_03360 [Verrucomicrobiae bacterium]|nr:hypothetical protein [Verrucomicrobiae bacterium]